ncbi:unnamed protein product [Scytosiphon promiscuus]
MEVAIGSGTDAVKALLRRLSEDDRKAILKETYGGSKGGDDQDSKGGDDQDSGDSDDQDSSPEDGDERDNKRLLGGSTCILHAALTGDHEMFEMIAEAINALGADELKEEILKTDEGGRNALAAAARGGNRHVFNAVLDALRSYESRRKARLEEGILGQEQMRRETECTLSLTRFHIASKLLTERATYGTTAGSKAGCSDK